MQYIVSQRKKGQQSHIVCNQHRAYEGDPYKHHCAKAYIAEFFYYVAGENIKELYVFKGAYNCQYAEKAGKRLVIEIIEILLVGRNYK